jgi:dipeptidyl aminopeptidase/acylaminoacyl peptidase
MTTHPRMRTALRLMMLSLPGTLAAQPAPSGPRPRPVPLIPIESLFSAPAAVDDAVSPDGRTIAFLAPWRGRLNIFVQPVAGGQPRRITSDAAHSIPVFWWSADGRRLLYLQDKGGDEQFHLFARTIGGAGAVHDLTPFRGVEVELLSLPGTTPTIAVITLNRRDPRLADAYRVNLGTGALELAAENPGSFLGYTADATGAVRVAYSVDSLGRYSLQARATEREPWRVVRTYEPSDRITPWRFHPDGTRLYMVSNAESDLARLVLVDLTSGAETPVDSDPLNQSDIDAPFFDAGSGALLVTAYGADTVRTYAHTAEARTMLALVRARAGRGALSVGSVSADRTRWVVTHSAPDKSHRSWLVHTTTGDVRLLHRVRPALDRYAMAPMRPVAFTARDGLPLHGYITEPHGRGARAGPLVVLVHGGPWERDRFDFQADLQMLANRGYAVLQVNFRGSTGFGKRFAAAARHEFAQGMHTDLLDGIGWAVAQGIADSTRVAIIGGSYGGYAALVGLTFTPRVFRCAVDYAGSSSLVTLLESFPPSWQPFLPRSWYPYVGDPRDSSSRADLLRRSPLFRVDSAVAPLLIFQGANDPRVTKAQSDLIAKALHRRGIPVTYLLAAAAGHSFGEAETSLAVQRATEQFLGQCLGGRSQASVNASITRTLRALRVDLDR